MCSRGLKIILALRAMTPSQRNFAGDGAGLAWGLRLPPFCRPAAYCLAASLLAGTIYAEPITFTKQVAPILFQSCSSCHRPGESAPFALLTYSDARRHATQIVAVTQSRYMPPWLPEPGHGNFAGERRLSESQIRLIADWVKQGSPEGDPADLPPQPRFVQGWQMGEPDLVIQLPSPYHLSPGGGDVFRNFVLPVDLKETKFVRAIELRPGNQQVVHHANIWIDRRRLLRRRDGQEAQPGFPGMDVITEARSESFDPDSHFLFWKPGSVAQAEPDEMSWRLDPGTDLILNLHLQPSGKEEAIQPSLGLYFNSRPPSRFPMLVQLEHDGALDIPPGSTDFGISDRLVLPVDFDVLAIYPHAHYIGKKVEAWATLPDGSRRELILIRDWDLNWQAIYRYRTAVSLPAGTVVEMRITYDNSDANPRNPNRPPRRIRAGPRSEDEMGHVWLQILPKPQHGIDPRMIVQEAVMRRRLEKYPGDFVSDCNLGALLVARGDFRGATPYYQEAVRVQPSSATARNGLGAALLGQGRVEDAMRELEQALRADPLHENARRNLARALAARGDMDQAGANLEALIRQHPEDKDARAALAQVYFSQRRYEAAAAELREAVRRRPGDADLLTSLGLALAASGDLPGAVDALEHAITANPRQEQARAYLARARAELSARRPR
jgi:Flp pilus assembly protein TadD/mono/diheme cytochrome c family protein